MSSAVARIPGLQRVSPWIVILIVTVGSFFSALIPPLQSPDENAHLMRAYLLGNLKIILDSHEGQHSGGLIDSGLILYSDAFDILPQKSSRKLSSDEISYAETIRWTGIKQFRSISGTAFYFPFSYTPQAIGLKIGEVTGLTIDSSYLLARFMSLCTIAVILYSAFRVYPVSPLLSALLILPMSMFQFSSTSLDGVSTALTVLSVALFLRISSDRKISSPNHFYTLVCSVVLLATSRIHAMPLLALVGLASFYIKRKKFYFLFIGATVLALVWTVIVMKTTVGFSNIVGMSASATAIYYIKNPSVLYNVFFSTISDPNIAGNYRDSFIGVLGSLDAGFNQITYERVFICLAVIAVFSISVKNLKTNWVPRVCLLFCALASVFLIFFALLITWNKHPANQIQGVQGRYFLIPVIMTAYAISGAAHTAEGFFRRMALILLAALGLFNVFSTSRLLIERYYMAPEQPDRVPVVMRPSEPLEPNNPIALVMSRRQLEYGQPIKRIGILFGTYDRKNPGNAELRLRSKNGQELAIAFDLVGVADNRYRYFDLNSFVYSSGEIFYLTGGGISIWNAYEEKENGKVATCLTVEYVNGRTMYTGGCPRY
jgi:uncharacterized membrane protein